MSSVKIEIEVVGDEKFHVYVDGAFDGVFQNATQATVYVLSVFFSLMADGCRVQVTWPHNRHGFARLQRIVQEYV